MEKVSIIIKSTVEILNGDIWNANVNFGGDIDH